MLIHHSAGQGTIRIVPRKLDLGLQINVSEQVSSQTVRLSPLSLPLWGVCSAGQRLFSWVHPWLRGLHRARDQVDGVLPGVVLPGNRQADYG